MNSIIPAISTNCREKKFRFLLVFVTIARSPTELALTVRGLNRFVNVRGYDADMIAYQLPKSIYFRINLSSDR